MKQTMRRRFHPDSGNSKLSLTMRPIPTISHKDKPETTNLEIPVLSKTSISCQFCSQNMRHTLIWLVVFGILSTLLLKSAFPIYLNVADEKFLDIQKCPACYGVCLCPAFLTGDIVPDSWSRIRATQLLNTKNVYFAKYRNKQVVLKKLAHSSRLENFDQHLIQQTKLDGLAGTENLSVSMAIRPYTHKNIWVRHVNDLQGNRSRLVHRLKVFNTNSQTFVGNQESNNASSFQGSEFLTCPSQRKFDYIENMLVKNNFGLYRLTCLYNLMTMLLVNSEPLIFQAFPANDGWPFPEYYGACGRVIVEEYVGPNLAQWLPTASWEERLSAALSMLKLAFQFTKGFNGFRLYATDLSLFNIAVGSNGSLKIIDGENIVVVDLEKIQRDQPENFNIPYASDDAGCQDLQVDPDCISYSEIDLCNRLENDHNFFVVCQELFSPFDKFGLSRGMPSWILKRFPQISQLQTECYTSSTAGKREKAAKQLINVYSEILSSLL